MELKVNKITSPEEINFNFEELKLEIEEKAKLYANIIYTDESIKEAKADKAKLNKFVKVLEDKRKEVKKQCLEPYGAFEKQIKELVRIMNEPIEIIDSQVKEFEERQKNAKLLVIEEYWERTVHPDWLTLDAVFDEKWLNASVKMKKIQADIDERVFRVNTDLITLGKLEAFSFEAIETYKQTLDLGHSIEEGQRLADIQARKEATWAEAAQEPERADEHTIREEEPKSQEGWASFRAKLTIAQLQKLREFFEKEQIEFEAI